MSYAAAIDELNAMAPELYSQPGQPRRKFSLDEIGLLLSALGNPHRRFRSVLIAGTNGKGSTAAALASILTAAGLRTGLYTSPHLTRPNERIRINGLDVNDETFAGLYFRVHSAAEQLVRQARLAQLPSFFETLTAMALLCFAAAEVDIAVLEVGMGGRLDATNIVSPLLSIVTDISLDHTEWLGSTVTAIAREKAGILRRNGTLITLPQHPEASQVLGEAAAALGARGVNAAQYMPPLGTAGQALYPLEVLGKVIQIDQALPGAHQQRNMALAIAAAVELALSHDFPITPEAIAQGVGHVSWPGRLERITNLRRKSAGEEDTSPSWVLDVAHNPAGAWALRAGLRGTWDDEGPQTLIFGCLRDKPVAEMAQILFPLFGQVIFAPIHSPRAAALSDLFAAAKQAGTPARAAASVAEALDLAEQSAPGGRIVISGSVYLVGEARPLVLARTGRQP